MYICVNMCKYVYGIRIALFLNALSANPTTTKSFEMSMKSSAIGYWGKAVPQGTNLGLTFGVAFNAFWKRALHMYILVCICYICVCMSTYVYICLHVCLLLLVCVLDAYLCY